MCLCAQKYPSRTLHFGSISSPVTPVLVKHVKKKKVCDAGKHHHQLWTLCFPSLFFSSHHLVLFIMSPQNRRFHCSCILLESFLLPFIFIIIILPCHFSYKLYCVYRLMEALGHCIKLCDKGREAFHRIVRLFSLPHQDDDDDRETSKQLILLHYVKTGKVKFPTYVTLKNRPIFSSREDLIRYGV